MFGMNKGNDFIVSQEQFGSYTKIKVMNEKNGLAFEVIPEKGAKINRLSFHNGKEIIDVIDGYDTPEETTENAYSKGSLLAPFPNRVADGSYSFEGRQYQLPINMPEEHNSIHGFVEHEKFQVIRSDVSDGVYFMTLQYEADGSSEGYPFPFSMDVTYRLTGDGLNTEISVVNTGSINMPFGHGWHPYFKTKGSVKGVELRLPPVEQIQVDDRLIPTGKKLAFDDFSELKQISDTQFDTGFRLLDGQGRVLLVDRRNNLQVVVAMEDEDNQYKYVQVFTPPVDSPAGNSIAIEPMTCEANAFNTGNGLLVLTPGEKFVGRYSVFVGNIEKCSKSARDTIEPEFEK